MTVRDWVIRKLLDDSRPRPHTPDYRIEVVGQHGFVAHRTQLPDARVYSPANSDTELLTRADLDSARPDVPGLGFVVLVRRRAANDVYPYADDLGLAIWPVRCAPDRTGKDLQRRDVPFS
jgi:hypothetical protein